MTALETFYETIIHKYQKKGKLGPTPIAKPGIPKSSRKNIFIFWARKFRAGLFEKNMTARVAIQKS